MKKKLFEGVGTALITPFTDGRVDYKALRRLTEYQIRQGTDALVVCGTTGESPTLSALEKLRCIETVADAADGRIPVIAGTGTNDTDCSARLTRVACREGADGVLAVTPYYNRPTAEGLYRHFLTIAEAGGKPTILYNIPARTGCDIPYEVYDLLADHELIVGVKEASGNLSKAEDLILKYRNRLAVYSGNDDLTLPILAIGGQGVISVVSNLLPTEMHAVCQLWNEGRYEESRRQFQELLPLIRALFTETNPIPVKAAMAYLGFRSPELRLPLCEAKPETVLRLVSCLKPLLGKE